MRLVALVDVTMGYDAEAGLIGVFQDFTLDFGLERCQLNFNLLCLHELYVDVQSGRVLACIGRAKAPSCRSFELNCVVNGPKSQQGQIDSIDGYDLSVMIL